MIRWLTCAIMRERIVVKTMLRAITPTNITAIRPIMPVSPAGTASSSTHCVILGIYRVDTLAIALKSRARISRTDPRRRKKKRNRRLIMTA